MDLTEMPGGLGDRKLIGFWAVALLAGVIAYMPGLDGPFLFDDFGSIAELGSRGGVRDWETFKGFVFGGYSGPTGRPLALLTFLIDANNWPADAWPFKRTNLVIHLINAALLGVLINKVLQLLEMDSRNRRWIVAISAACWLLHPFLVSTTLYVVQRMAQLATLFVFLGFIAYLHGRSLLASNALKAYLIMSLSVGVFTFLAMISKENGILLPLLIGTLEVTVLASQRARLPRLNRYWAIVFLVLPSTIIALYLGGKFLSDDFFRAMPPRDFSTYERLLTQPRILVDYLRHWFVPELYTVGVFQDHFIKSTGILSPITTLFAIVFHLALIVIAVIKRQRWPLFAFAVLFFYASHLIESTVINLELYFEHRNYLASAFLFVPVVVLLQSQLNRRLFFVVAAGALLLLAGITRYTATVWADHDTMVEASAQKAPTSARAQMLLARNLYNRQQYDESIRVIDEAIANIPDNHALLISRSNILCNLGILEASDFEDTARKLAASIYDPRSIRLYTSLGVSIVEGRCPSVTADSLREMFENMLDVAENSDPRLMQFSQIQYLIGYTSVHIGEPERAVSAFEKSLDSRPGAAHAMLMAADLASGDYYDEALHFSGIALQQLKAGTSNLMQGAPVNESDIHAFRATVRADREAAAD